MIISLITGGAGNQLSMYSFGRAFAEKNNHIHRVDLGQYEYKPDPKKVYSLHKYVLDRTKLNPIAMTREEIEEHCRTTKTGMLTERVLGYSESIWDIKSESLWVNMYAADYRYSQPIIAKLREELTPMVPMGGEFKNLYDEMRDGETVSLHVRLMDYVRNPNCLNLPITYYRDALKVVANGASGLRVYLFTDEPELIIKGAFNPGLPYTIISNGPDRNLEDMTLMTACKHHVVANSSFSFWGAWLDGKMGGITVVPDLYHRPDCKQLLDSYKEVIQPSYPPDWNVVKVRLQ